MYAALITKIRDSLTPENWGKHSYFDVRDTRVCACIHGTVQKFTNPGVRKLKIENKKILTSYSKDWFLDSINVTYRGGAIEDTLRFCRKNLSAAKKNTSNKHEELFQTWKMRPIWVRDPLKNHGNLNVHYLLRMFGVTFGFNDSSRTTLERMKRKLTEIADWAKENEKFLIKN